MLTKGRSRMIKLQYFNVQFGTLPSVKDCRTLNESDSIKILNQQHKLEDVQTVGLRLII